MTTTPDNFLNSGTQSFETGSNWSAGSVPDLNNDADIGLAASTTVNMDANELVNSIGIGTNDTLNINDVTFEVAAGTGSNAILGMINVNNGGTLDFKGAGVDNPSDIVLNATSASTEMEIAGSTTISGTSTTNGTIWLGGVLGLDLTTANFNDNKIVSDGKDNVTLTLIDQTLKGAGTVGDSHLMLDNGSGSVIGATTAGYPLFLNTGSNTIQNAGTLEAQAGGFLVIDSPVHNTGTILSTSTGSVISVAFGAVTGTGAIDIGTGATLDVSSGGSIAENVALTGAHATLDMLPGDVSGTVTGTEVTDAFDVSGLGFGGTHAVWQQTSSSGGTLSLYAGGTAFETLNLTGQFNTLDFAVSFDGITGALVTVQNTPSYTENPGNVDEWILSDGNWAESAGPGPSPTDLSGNPYQFAGTGDWTTGGASLVPTDGILWYDPNTGDVDEWQLSNAEWSASVDLGSHPANSTDGASYQIAGIGNFTGGIPGNDDVLWTSTNNTGMIATDIWELGSGGQWTNSVSPGLHPAGYAIAAIGDWTGPDTDGILWFNSSTGDTDEWQLSGGQWAASVDLGSHPANATDGASYQISGAGDFFDNGRDGVLWTSVNANGTIATDIWELNSSGQWMASVSPGNHPAGYSVVGVGDFTGTGTSDILWYNASTGDTDEWLINNGNWSASIDLGTHPGSAQIAGVGDFNGAGNAGVLWHASS